jgi:hypothetical protein
MDGLAPPIRIPPPALGQHSRELLVEVGYTDATLDALIAASAVVQAPIALSRLPDDGDWSRTPASGPQSTGFPRSAPTAHHGHMEAQVSAAGRLRCFTRPQDLIQRSAKATRQSPGAHWLND